MTRTTWYWRTLCAVTVSVAFVLTAAAADEKETKGADKAKGGGQTIVIQIDASKISPELLKQLIGLSQIQKKGDDKKPATKEDDKKASGKKNDNEEGQHGNQDQDNKKGSSTKPNIVQVDLNKLSPDLAKKLTAELGKGKETKKGGNKEGNNKEGNNEDDDEREGKKGGKKKDKDDDEREEKKGGKKKEKDDDD